MNNLLKDKNVLITAGIFLFLAVMLGAFGAHALEKSLEPKHLKTYMTGVTYQFYHGLGLMLVTVVSNHFRVNLEKCQIAFMIGIVLFSFNCYLYAISGIKFFAMIVPLGGISFILGWLMFILAMVKKEAQ